MELSKDSTGILFSTDTLLIVFLLVLILGIVANMIDSSNDKILSPLEVAELERLSGEVVDSLINDPGTPSHWEDLFSYDGVRMGLAIENNVSEGIPNTVSFKKIKILENGFYDELIGKKIFNSEIKSSIGLYPIASNIDPIIVGDDISSNSNITNIVGINRIVKCDFYQSLAMVYISNGKIDKTISGNSDNSLSNNRNICNHETLSQRNHSETGDYKWICKEFKVTRKNFQKNNYYLIFNDESLNNGNYWVLDNVKNISKVENNINSEKIELNPVFESIFEDESSMIFYLHFKVHKNNLNDFNAVLVEVPEDIDIDNLNIDYFKEQDCNFIMRTCYG